MLMMVRHKSDDCKQDEGTSRPCPWWAGHQPPRRRSWNLDVRFLEFSQQIDAQSNNFPHNICTILVVFWARFWLYITSNRLEEKKNKKKKSNSYDSLCWRKWCINYTLIYATLHKFRKTFFDISNSICL